MGMPAKDDPPYNPRKLTDEEAKQAVIDLMNYVNEPLKPENRHKVWPSHKPDLTCGPRVPNLD